MRPLSDLPDAALRALRGVAFDIDDTVTAHGKLQPEAFHAMWRLQVAGLTLIAVTGRPLGWAAVVARHWPVDLAIGENGAGWFRACPGAALNPSAEGYFEDSVTRAAQQATLATLRAAVAEAMPEIQLADDQGGRRCDLAFDVGEHHQVSAEDVAKLSALIEAHGARAVVSSVHAHAMPGSWTKASGLLRGARDVLDQDLDAERERWIFIGDSGNDVEAFEHFPYSVGVANVRQRMPLRHEPKYVTEAARGAGFAELAARILAAR